jgi:beta-glucosidase
VDLNCQLGYHDQFSYANCLPAAVQEGTSTPFGAFAESYLDTSLVRLFTARMRLGEFDDPATVPWVRRARAAVPAGTWSNSDANGAVTQTPARLALAREAAAEAIVLLRNATVGRPNAATGPLLPLRVPSTGDFDIAVVGVAARPPSMYLGGYSSIHGPAGVANQVNGYDGIVAALRELNPNARAEHLTGPQALERVGDYDAVLVYAGTDATTAAEDTDRASLALPDGQEELIRTVAARNPSTIVYLETIGQVDLGALTGVPAVLWSSYNGQRKGEALADVLFGRTNPSGRLPFTWYEDAGQLPALGDYGIRPTSSNPGRTYMYFTGSPAYPFGHGLSYTGFQYAPTRLDRAEVTPDDTVTITADITNVGAIAGAEVVQLYVATPGSSAGLERPARRLAGFAKLVIPSGQTRTVSMAVRIADLAFFNEAQDRFVVDPGSYRFELGSSSADIRQTVIVTVSGSLTPAPVVLTAHPVAADDGQLVRRVVFRPGSVVMPRLTVAMNDDTRYGYSADGSGTALPATMAIHFATNRPEVVSVDASGSIRAVGHGVATVTATLTSGAASVTTAFTLAVAGSPLDLR